jgi:hypothetical protein
MSDRGQAIQSLLDCIDVIQTEELASEYAPTIRRARYAIGLLQTAQAHKSVWTCCECGDKDWMASPSCSESKAQEPDYDPRSVSFNLLEQLAAAHEAAATIPDIIGKIKARLEKYGHTVVPLSPFVAAEFVEPEAPAEPDMSDWRNWREGDKFEFVKNFERNYGDYFCIGNIYEYGRDKYGDTGIKDSSGAVWAESMPLSEYFRPEHFRFHSRPKGE